MSQYFLGKKSKIWLMQEWNYCESIFLGGNLYVIGDVVGYPKPEGEKPDFVVPDPNPTYPNFGYFCTENPETRGENPIFFIP